MFNFYLHFVFFLKKLIEVVKFLSHLIYSFALYEQQYQDSAPAAEVGIGPVLVGLFPLITDYHF